MDMKLRLAVLSTDGEIPRGYSPIDPLIELWIPDNKHHTNGDKYIGFGVLQYTDSEGDDGWQNVPVAYGGARVVI